MIRTNMKQRALRRPRYVAWALTLATGVFTTMTFVSGCESTVTSYCVSRCNCQGCSQVERADCLDDVEDSQRLADHDGCATEFADYLACYTGEGACSEGAWVASTCAPAANALRTCSARSARFVKTACEEEKDKRATCGLTGGGADPCGGADECTAYCALGASCSELANPMDGSAYVNCVIDCTSTGSSSSGGSSGGP